MYLNDVVPSMRFHLQPMSDDDRGPLCLIVSTNEQGFSDDNVRDICRSAHSQKQLRKGCIGRKGIGFKSVFTVSDCPMIFSNGFQFALPAPKSRDTIGYVVPEWLENPPLPLDMGRTHIVLPLTAKKCVPSRIVHALESIEPSTLLFLSKLCSIEVSIETPSHKSRIVIKKVGDQTPILRTESHCSRNETVSSVKKTFWVARQTLQVPAGLKDNATGSAETTLTIALPIDHVTCSGKLFTWLPVLENTGLPFMVNGDFNVAASRQDIHADDDYNVWLLDHVPNLFVDTFVQAVSSDALSIDQKTNLYHSIPVEPKTACLERTAAAICSALSKAKCVLLRRSSNPIEPVVARVAGPAIHAAFDSANGTPAKTDANAHIVARELAGYRRQLAAIGVKHLSAIESLAAFSDDVWLARQAKDWYLKLIRAMSSAGITREHGSRGLRLLPVSNGDGANHTLHDPSAMTCFPLADNEANREVDYPDWLRAFCPISFIDKSFCSALCRESDAEKLLEWIRNNTTARSFSHADYCETLWNKTVKSHRDLTDGQLVEITDRLSRSNIKQDWKDYPFCLSDGSRRTLREIQTHAGGRPASQELVMPETVNPKSGWQLLFATAEDRRHFHALREEYASIAVHWLRARNIQAFPGLERIEFREMPPEEYPEERSLYESCSASSFRTNPTVTTVRLPRTWPAYNLDQEKRTQFAVALCEFLRHEIQFAPTGSTYGSDGRWHEVKTLFVASGVYRRRYQRSDDTDTCRSSVQGRLRTEAWLPSTKGFVPPTMVFVPLPELKELFGDHVPFALIDIPREVGEFLGVHYSICANDVLNYLEQLRQNKVFDPALVNKLYQRLATLSAVSPEVRIRFSTSALIYVPIGDSGGWHSPETCIWDDCSTFPDIEFASLSPHYPQFEEFFCTTIGVRRSIDREWYAKRWLALQRTPSQDAVRVREQLSVIYRQLMDTPKNERESQWWRSLIGSAHVLTRDSQWAPAAEAIVVDDEPLAELFADEILPFCWVPDKPGPTPARWLEFFRLLGGRRLTDLVTQDLVEVSGAVDQPEHSRYVTPACTKMLATSLSYHHDKVYQSCLGNGFFSAMFSNQERSAACISIRTTLQSRTYVRSIAHTVFCYWKRVEGESVLYFTRDAETCDVAETIAAEINRFARVPGIAATIETYLRAESLRRIERSKWQVPEAIAKLASQCVATESHATNVAADHLPVPASPSQASLDNGNPTESARPEATPLLGSAQSETFSRPLDVGEPPAGQKCESGLIDSKQSNVEEHTPSNSVSGRSVGLPRLPFANHVTQSQQAHSDSERAADSASGHRTESRTPNPSECMPPVGSNASPHESLDVLAEISKSFNRSGATTLREEFESPESPAAMTPAQSVRRAEALAQRHSEARENEPAPAERRHSVERTILEGPDPLVRAKLETWYSGRCQICDQTFPDHRGLPFFVAGHLFARKLARVADGEAVALCLCPTHFAQWLHATTSHEGNLPDVIGGWQCTTGTKPTLAFTLAGTPVKLRFHPHHALALQTFVRVHSSPSADLAPDSYPVADNSTATTATGTDD